TMSSLGSGEEEESGGLFFCEEGGDECVLAVFPAKGSPVWTADKWQERAQSGQPPNSDRPHEVATVFLRRSRLAQITRERKWEEDDLVSVREVADLLATTIESTLLAMLSSDIRFTENLNWEDASTIFWTLTCSILPNLGSSQVDQKIYLTLKRRTTVDGLIESGWEADKSELESVLSLWVWSLKGKKPEKLSRLLAITSTASTGTQLTSDFQLWRDGGKATINETKITDKTYTNHHNRFFGWQNIPKDKVGPLQVSVLELPSRNSLEVICAQDIYALFFRSLMHTVVDIGGETSVKGEHRSLRLSNSNITQIQKAFTDSGLGSNDDAFACIFPTLRLQNKLPSIHGVINGNRTVVERHIREGKWKEAEKVLLWSISHITLPESREDTVTITHGNEPIDEDLALVFGSVNF